MSIAGDNAIFEIADLAELPRLLAGLAQLWRAYHARPHSTGHRDRGGVSGAVLAQAGLTCAHLSLLLEKGCADFASGDSDGQRASRERSLPVALTEDTHFFLTPTGESLVGKILRAYDGFSDARGSRNRRADDGQSAVFKPHWDRQRRELRVGNVLLKRFRSTAPNQELVLAAFEAAGWANGIDDPLPNCGSPRATVRLDGTIRRLNRTLQQPLIRFERASTGCRVTWRYLGTGEDLLRGDNGRSLLIG